MQQSISIRGAREHNLKGIDIDLPRNRLIVITGLSGSGKSSLAFDTVYAEGQRRYVESLSAYARQFLELMEKPDVDSIEGLSPAIAIDQKTTSRNPRSTVGTVTESTTICGSCGRGWESPTLPRRACLSKAFRSARWSIRSWRWPRERGCICWRRWSAGARASIARRSPQLMKRGFQRLKVDGALYAIDDVPALDKNRKHDIEVVVDRLVVREGLGNRLADSIETALELSDGLLITEDARDGGLTTFSARFACPVSGFSIDEIEPRLFSFNNPHGACPQCAGLGVLARFDAALVVPDEERSLAEGAVRPWAGASTPYYRQTLESLAAHYRVSMAKPWRALPAAVRDAILRGSGGEAVTMHYDDGLRRYATTRAFEGVLPNLERRYRETENAWLRKSLARYQTETRCESLQRLSPETGGARSQGRGRAYRRGRGTVDRRRSGVVRRGGRETGGNAARDRRAHPARNRTPPRLPRRCGPRISQPRARVGDAFGRRKPAHPPRVADRLRADGGALCTRRAVDRPAPARQRAPVAHARQSARSRQHGDRGRARRGRDSRRRPSGGHGAGRGRAWRASRRRRAAQPDHPRQRQPDRPVSVGAARHTGPRSAARGQAERTRPGRATPRARRIRRARKQPQERDGRDPAWDLLLRHRRFRQRQIQPDREHAVSRGRAAAQPRPRAPGRARRHRGHRASRQGGRDRPVAHRPDAAGRTRRPIPGPSRRSASGSPGCPSRGSALQAGPLFLQREGGGVARAARATESSRSRCTSCRTFTSPATPATAPATTAKPWR